ncbi:double-strand break repair helicase AddA [Shimia sp. FJ5]|uniref:double-strand break repair helicase AddA n=1 Tax=Shimia sp. FJ5 TaxID=3079054 RepID=UPI00262D2F11|nr:double-strand break repair helicase AddA [Shimia sp. FJ5]MDV4144673.1 double-strand break repair helicase AddA [Shimia sp. FJ5]
MKRNEATERQVQAAHPSESTWLSANAGSGKTRVLTDRVARLLLNGVLPQHILCLTYTKAAASEMQNRLFQRLGAWAMRDKETLSKELAELGVPGPLDDTALRSARTLFARAIETPGGLKIQTIHSFCSSILRRFPLEAGVSPLFKEMEERAADLLREDIVETMAQGADASLLATLSRHFTGEDLGDLTRDITGRRQSFSTPKPASDFLEGLGHDRDLTLDAIGGRVFLGGEAALFEALVPILRASKITDNRLADALSSLTSLDASALPTLERFFLTGDSAKSPFTAKIDAVPTKPVRDAHPELINQLNPLMLRVEDNRQKRIAVLAAERAAALSAFACRFVELYERQKQLRGWLDFDDLILRTRDLLEDKAVAEWVLYRLDGGIDHILVDEAQDTSPVQWQVIERLAQEFTSGSGARSEVERTIFVVGDKKQSIYSFQGADPAEFDRMREEFAERLKPTGKSLKSLGLEYSFRSSQAVLRLVDTTFKPFHNNGFPQDTEHKAFHGDLPGRVDLWPVIDKSVSAEKDAWYQPVDRIGETHHDVILANRIADQIARMISEKETIPTGKPDENGLYSQTPVQPGDILVLVQRRSTLFHEIIRACKARDLPIAGADRLRVGGELAVKDLAALLRFLDTPEDNLSLATVLRSPLFGWSEQALFDLAHRRTSTHLWRALRDREKDFPDTMAVIWDLMENADFLRPYDLIERILTRHDGRRKLLARLGAEAEDGINALLSQALAYERSAVPSLTGFLVWMETDDLEIKRQMDSAGNRIRVMTVHGSKGLEAPIVILPDTAQRNPRNAAPLIDLDGEVFWVPRKELMPEALTGERDRAKGAELEERLRLLYVAMTRAEKWLIVAAAGELGKDGRAWYDIVKAGLTSAGAEPFDFPVGQGLRYTHGDWSGPSIVPEEAPNRTRLQLPAYFQTPAPLVVDTKKTLSPSELGGAKALPGEAGLDEDAAMQRGSRIHLLLEHLPTYAREDWAEVAPTILSSGEISPSPAETADLLNEAQSILIHPSFAELFAAETLAEVPVTADLGAARLHGVIDRLVIGDDRVLAVDFKTNAITPETPEQTPLGLLRQMGAYAQALAQIYPKHRIETAILWTRSSILMPLPHDLVTNALLDGGYLDDRQEAT